MWGVVPLRRMREGYLINPVTAEVNGHIVCEIIPLSRRGYKVVCALSRPGKEATFAEHGTWPTREAAFTAIQEVFEAMKRNPTIEAVREGLQLSKIRAIMAGALIQSIATKSRRNPSLYEAFHGAKSKVVRASFNPPKPGEKLVAVGEIEEIVYRPIGSSKRRGILYSHKAGDTGEGILPNRALLATNQRGTELYIIKDKRTMRMTERGLIG